MCRRIGMRLCSTDKCPLLRRPTRPGQHGAKPPKRPTEYGRQMVEKQKAKQIYGVMETQFRNVFEKARKQGGATDKNLLLLLERRLDNVIYRIGLAKTRAQARQYVGHGFFTVNGRKLKVPSSMVRVGDTIAIRKGAADRLMEPFTKGKKEKELPVWVTVDVAKNSFSTIGLPVEEDLPKEIDAKLIVEFYSR